MASCPCCRFSDSDVQFPASVWACPLSLLEQGEQSSAGRSTDPATQPEASALAPSNVLSGVASQEWHTLDFGPFMKQWELGAVLANLSEIRLSKGEGENNPLAAGAVDLSLSHEVLIICLRAAGWSAVRRQNWMFSCLQEKRRKLREPMKGLVTVVCLCRRAEHPGSCWSSALWGRARGRALVERVPAGGLMGMLQRLLARLAPETFVKLRCSV